MGQRTLSVAALRRKISWQSGAQEHHKVTLTDNLTQEIYWERHKRMTASAWERSSKDLYRFPDYRLVSVSVNSCEPWLADSVVSALVVSLAPLDPTVSPPPLQLDFLNST